MQLKAPHNAVNVPNTIHNVLVFSWVIANYNFGSIFHTVVEYALHLCSRDVIKWHLNEVIFEFTAGLGSQASCELSNMSRTEVKNSGMDELPGGRVYVCCNFAFSECRRLSAQDVTDVWCVLRQMNCSSNNVCYLLLLSPHPFQWTDLHQHEHTHTAALL